MADTTSLDFSLMMKDPAYVLNNIQQQLQAQTNGEWSDYSNADVGWLNVLTQVGLNNNDSMFLDSMTNECFLITAKLRNSVVLAAKSRGYQIGTATAATLTMRINCPAFNTQLNIPANTQWNVNGYTFTCLDQIIIPAGQTSVVVTLTQGTPYSLSITATGSAWLPVNVPWNIYNMVVTVNGTTWTEINAWIDPPVQTAYVSYENANQTRTIEFGNNISTMKPNSGDAIVVTGILTDGASGNFELSGITANLLTVVRDVDGNNVTNSLTGMTTSFSSGGLDVESTTSIRQNAPQNLAANARAVTVSDYAYWAAKYPGVTSVACIGGELIGRYSEVWVYIFGTDPYNVSPDLIANVQAYLDALAVGTIKPVVKAPNIIEMFQTCTVGVVNSFTDASTIQNQVNTALNNYVSGLGIGGGQASGYRQSIANGTTAPTQISGVLWTETEFNLQAFCTSANGLVSISVPNGIDLTNASLTNAAGNSILTSNGQTVQTADLTQYVTNNVLTMTFTGLSDQVITLGFNSQTSDVILNYNQILIMKNLTVTPQLPTQAS